MVKLQQFAPKIKAQFKQSKSTQQIFSQEFFTNKITKEQQQIKWAG